MAETTAPQARPQERPKTAQVKTFRFFSEDIKYASYIGAGIIFIASLALGFSLGKYKPVSPYIVPVGNATRTSGTPWTLFNQPWVLPHGSSASLTDTIIGLGILLALAPVAYVALNNYRYLGSVERNIPRFLRDILESTDSGIILPKALIQASVADYGPISREIGIAMTKFSLGYDFRDSVMEACRKLRHPYMTQVGLIIVEAYSAGGRMHDVLNSSVVLFNGLEEYTEEKQSELKPYTQLVYISVIIFLLIAYIIVSQFIGPLNKLPVGFSGSGLASGLANGKFSFKVTKLPVVYFESIFFMAGVLESIFGGIVVGKIVDASASAGLRHSIILLAITIVVFNAPFIGIFSII